MMVGARTKKRWDTRDYRRIVSVSSDAESMRVAFGDGSQAHLRTRDIAHPYLHDPDWCAVTAGEFELRVPTPTGDFEIP